METLDNYLMKLASDAPVPGGGSAAAVVAASGAALIAMVARISGRNPKYAAHDEAIRRIVNASDRLGAQLRMARERDELAFEAVLAAQGLPRATGDEKNRRGVALESALHAAAQAPLNAASLALEVLRQAARLLDVPNQHLASDVGCAAEFGFAALSACAYNVRVNHRYMRDQTVIATQTMELARCESEGAALIDRIRSAVGAILSRPNA